MDRLQLPQDCRATMRKQFTFNNQVPKSSWYSFDQPRKNERLNEHSSHYVVLKPGPLDW